MPSGRRYACLATSTRRMRGVTRSRNARKQVIRYAVVGATSAVAFQHFTSVREGGSHVQLEAMGGQLHRDTTCPFFASTKDGASSGLPNRCCRGGCGQPDAQRVWRRYATVLNRRRHIK